MAQIYTKNPGGLKSTGLFCPNCTLAFPKIDLEGKCSEGTRICGSNHHKMLSIKDLVCNSIKFHREDR